MDHFSSTPTDLRLERRAIHRMADAAGMAITCREGTVWITVDNDPRDIVLEAGESFCASEHGRTLIYALEPSSVRLAAQPQQQCVRSQPLLAASALAR